MMIKCQKCGFENQMGSIFCRDCGEKLNMDAIDPNKLQKDVDKEKNLKRAKKRIKSAISGGISILVVVAFVFLVFPDLFPFGKMRQYEEPAGINETSVKQKYNNVVNGSTSGNVKYSYAEINQMLKTEVVEPLAELDSFAKVTGMEVAFDETKNQPVAYVWISIKEKVPVLYTVRGDFVFTPTDPDSNEIVSEPISVDVKRLDIGRLPLFVSTHTFLNGFKSLVDNEAMQNFFSRAKNVEFTPEGMNVEFAKGVPGAAAPAPSSSGSRPSASAGVAALKGGSTAAISEKDEAAREAARQKAEEEKERKRQLAEERKRKQEEEAERKRQKEEERKQKIEEEKERKRQAEEERKRRIEEENERRRQEAEDRRREREERRNNNNYNSRNSRNRNSRNNRW